MQRRAFLSLVAAGGVIVSLDACTGPGPGATIPGLMPNSPRSPTRPRSQSNHDFIVETPGVDPRPYYRPPFGYRNARTDQLAASIGCTTPPEHIVIGDLNFMPVTNVFPALLDLITSRGLTTVTLDDVFVR